MKFEDLNINLNGMTLLEVVKAYPEAVVAAIEKSAEENKIMPDNPFMDLSDLEDMLLKTITEGIEHFFKRNSTVSVLYRNFAENTRSTVEQLNHKNKILLKSFKELAERFNIKYSEGHGLYDIEHNISTLMNRIDELSREKKPHQRYLAFSMGDEYGHTNCYVVTSKSEEYVNLVCNKFDDQDITEFLTEHHLVTIVLSNKLNKSVDEILEYDEEELTKELKIFLMDLISDEKISTETFSEYLYSLIDTHRESGNASCWVLI